MTIDIDRLTEAELIDLNHRVVARLKFLHQMRAHAHMLDFSIGQQWNVAPVFLRKPEPKPVPAPAPETSAGPASAQVIHLPRK